MSVGRHSEIYELYERGELDTAMTLAIQNLCRQDFDGRAWEVLGLVMFAKGKFCRSVFALERASLFVPLRPAARVCLAHGYGRVGRTELSRDLLLELIPDKSLSQELLLQVAAGFGQIDQNEFAVQACREACRREPEAAQPYYDLAFFSSRCGRPSHLVEALVRRAISLDRDNANYRIGLASMLQTQGRLIDAYSLIEELSRSQIESISCRNCLERVMGLYKQGGDSRRVLLCEQHLLQLCRSDEGCC